MPSETAAELLAQAARDYGTPAERAERANQARAQRDRARIRAQEAASTPRGKRP
ncbi:hypothetical protein OG216_19590 [Streptomycetaceae bacterium NBC_01309]